MADDEVTRLRECVARLSLALALAAGEAERWRPPAPPLPPVKGRKRRVTYRRAYLPADVAELALALDRWHRGTGSLYLPADVVLAVVRGLGYRRIE